MRSSQAAVDLIIESEIGSRKQYDANYASPTWPGGSSGVTIGIGYDLGYMTREKVVDDFGPYIPSAQIVALQNVVGLKGEAARAALATVKNKVIVPWSVAMKVFEEVDLPRYEAMLIKACPGAEKLPPDCFGALTGLTYNRGPGCFTAPGDRFSEGRAIREAIASGQFDTIPTLLRRMKRLWGPSLAGLGIRREKEAQLFEQGLRGTPAGNPEKQFDIRAESVQRSLAAMNYHEVGEPDGKFGGKTRAAIVAFMVDRGKPPLDGELTQAVVDEVNAAIAEKWTRPIKPERANVTAKDLANKLPTINQTWWQKVWAYILGLPSATAAVFKYVFGDQPTVSGYIDPVKNFFAAIPPELYFLVVAGIAIAIFIQAKKVQDNTVKDYQTGKIN